MDYNKLKTFVIVAERGSITAAANDLMRSQSAISQQILLLEEELEVMLLERRSGKIHLSKDGEQVLAFAKQNLEAIDNEVHKLKKTTASVEGHIRVGMLNDFTEELRLGEHFGSFCRKYENISFTIIDGPSQELEQALIKNEIDLGFTVYFEHPEMFIQHPIAKTYSSLYASKSYLKKHGVPQKYKDIVGAHLIDFTEDFACIGNWMRKNSPRNWAGLKHRRPNIVTPNLETARHIILAGYGISILPNYLMENDLKKGKVQKLFPSSKDTFGGLDLVYRTNHSLKLCEQLFVTHMTSRGES